MNRGCHFDGPFRGLLLDDKNETRHYDGPSKGYHLERDFGVDYFDGSYAEVISHFWDLKTTRIKEEEPTPVENYFRNIKMNENTNRNETSLPFKEDFVLLPDNYELCRKRIQNFGK